MIKDIKLNNLPNHIPDNIREIISDFLNEILKVYEKEIEKVILFGSYARGDYDGDSDIDILILTNIKDNDNTFFKIRVNLYGEITYKIEQKYDFNFFISPILRNIDNENENTDSFFYQNIQNEGVCIYERI